MPHRWLLVPNQEKSHELNCAALRNYWDVSWESIILLCASETMHLYPSVTVTLLPGPRPCETLDTYESCFQTPILPPTGWLSLKKSWNKTWWMSALPSRSPGSLQLPISKDFVSPSRSSAIYTPERVGFSSLNTNVKRPGFMEDTLQGNATVQSYIPRVSVWRERSLWQDISRT